jgi:Zn-dependent peptidase ImmA (M78 family)
MRPKGQDQRVEALLAHHDWTGPPHALIEQLCRNLLEMVGATVPVDLEVVASYRNAEIHTQDQDQAETIVWNGRRFIIRIRRADTAGRQRFSCAHAIVHTYFLQAGQGSPASQRQSYWSVQEEALCDAGAAELLLPREPFLRICPPVPTMDQILELAEVFRASAEATAYRAAALSSVPMAVAVLEPALKPAELRRLAKRQVQPALPGMEEPAPSVPRLRVQSSYGKGGLFIPKHKSIDESTPLGEVLTEETVDYVGQTGLHPGRLRVSARRLPIRRQGVLVDRVVALLAEATPDSQDVTYSA